MLVSACSQSMLETGSVEGPAGLATASPPGACHVNAGAYFLPKRLVHVEIGGSPANYGLKLIANTELVSDTTDTFCLDFLLSAFSNDRVGIQRSENGLLARIYTFADDRSKPIANAIIQATGDLIAASKAQELADLGRSAQLQLSDTALYATLDYDPFDRREAEAVNKALRPFGYCVYMDDRDDPYVEGWSPQLCRQPSAGRAVYPDQQERADARKLMQRGVLYRPELSHRIKILRKKDPDSPSEPWLLAGTEYVSMPNHAPIFALGVNRAMFVTAETDVVFENGLLKNVTVVKPSELNAAVDIPLYAAQVALSIPAATLSIFQNEAANRKELWQTNAELIQTLRKMRQDTTADQALAKGDISVGQRLAVGPDGGGAVAAVAPAAPGVRSAETTSPALQRLGSCLDDETINATPEGRAQCFQAMQAGE
ncbi:hypothetical protein [Mesorhizobium sp. GbtcB19]|uniref:hypothetical protein n=1 Tax=Mesorhizobium sp. GbtcB19 TaxID=2824764 RepID=UPI001C301117|nr:hypothetical protein [Mesorhizobium sp. GbtcB19]